MSQIKNNLIINLKRLKRISLLKDIFFPKYKINNDEISISCNPFFIIGSGRSGNTLLRSILVTNPKIAIPPESYVLSIVARKFQSYSFLPWEDIVKIIVAEFESSNEFSSWGINMHPVYKKLYILKEKEKTLAKIIDEIYCHYGREKFPGFEIWGDKTPQNTLNLEWIEPIFKEAKYIHIIRDGRDVVSSYLKMGRYNTVEEAAERWKKSIRFAKRLAERKSNNYKEVRYEELVSKTEEEVKKICNFLDIKFIKDMINTKRFNLKDTISYKHHRNLSKPISTSSIGKYKRNLSSSQIKKVEKLLNHDLTRLGYSL
jgi:uncharacterized protein YajQ (UPF0234 family)